MDFQTQKVLDDRLMITDKITYGVLKGGEQSTAAVFSAISESTNQHTYNIQVPSLQTVIDRRVIVESTITLKVVGVPANTKNIVDYGKLDALAPFPFHSLATVMTATVNNTSVSCNTRDVIAPLLRLHNRRDLQLYNGGCPVMPDNCQNYDDLIDTISNPLGGYANVGVDNNLVPRGAFNVVIGSALTNGVPTGALVAGDGTAQRTAYIQFTTFEPLLFLSPFTYATADGASGLLGIQNLNFTFNMGDAARVLRYSTTELAAGQTGKTVSVESYTGSKLHFMFLTPHASDVMPSRNVVPYIEVPRYLQSNFQSVANNTAFTYRSSSITLNQVPDKLIFGVRSRAAAGSGKYADAFLPINNISINFNNVAGVLSSASTYQLWSMAVENGSNQSFQEWKAVANRGRGVVGAGDAGAGTQIKLCGSVGVLEFGKDIPLPDYLACGSLGNFLLQIDVNATNNTGASLADAELFIITVNSGLFVSERGTSSLYTGILTKADVMDASEQPAVSYSKSLRMVGSGALDRLKSALSKGFKVGKVLAPVVPEVMSAISAKGGMRKQRLI